MGFKRFGVPALRFASAGMTRARRIEKAGPIARAGLLSLDFAALYWNKPPTQVRTAVSSVGLPV